MCVPVYADMWLSLRCVDTRLVYSALPVCLHGTYIWFCESSHVHICYFYFYHLFIYLFLGWSFSM